MTTQITNNDVKNYLLRVYFGPLRHDPVRKAVNRAYRDFNRTLRGFSSLTDGESIRTEAHEYLENALAELISKAAPMSQSEFDSWHERTCVQLSSLYGDFKFHVGQAQKWINMAIKYIFVIDRTLIDPQWACCHVPIDQILLQQLRQAGHTPPRFGKPWSRISCYSSYLAFQKWFRAEFDGIPMDVEFGLWMGTPEDTSYAAN